MKTSIPFLPVFTLATAILAIPAFAQLNVPSDGSDGALNVTSNTVIDLSQAVTGTWSANNAAQAGNGVYDPTKWAVVFKYSSVNITNGATVSFLNHYAYPPVIWLVQSNVIINGTVSVNGNGGTSATPGQYLLTEPGPGGYRGGAVEGGIGYGEGLGPGGGINNNNNLNYWNGSYQSSYGNPQILPLIGGSGSSSFNQCDFISGASGGGAILIAAGGTVTVNGSITAFPGISAINCYGYYSSEGAGGGIRIVANQIAGSGAIAATPQGRTRMEANSISQQLNITPNAALVLPGATPVIFPSASAPSVSIVSVAGQSSPADPTANVVSAPDISISTNSQTTVVLQTQNFPITGTVTVRVVPVYGPSSTLTATNVSGTTASATWQLTAQMPAGYCVLQAHATSN